MGPLIFTLAKSNWDGKMQLFQMAVKEKCDRKGKATVWASKNRTKSQLYETTNAIWQNENKYENELHRIRHFL